MLKIGVDGNLLCGKRTGMGTVVHNVLPYWKASPNCTIKLYVPEKLESAYEEKLRSNGIEIQVLTKGNYFKWEQSTLPGALKRDSIDVLWCPYNTAPLHVPCKTVVTINDVIYMMMPISSAPSLYKKLGIIYRRTIVPKAAKKASRIITISEFARKDILKVFPMVGEKTTVIYLGADYSGVCLDARGKEAFFERNLIKEPYILGFGSLEARKNSFALIRAFEKLARSTEKGYKLVLFGFRGFEESEQYKYIQAHQLTDVVLLGYVTDAEKNTLYKSSRMFVFPSLSEGFGIPVLEAFANKTPVITSNTSSIPEVAGNAAILIDPENEGQLVEAMQRLLRDDELSNGLVASGLLQLGKFNWSKTADEILRQLEETVGKNR